MSLGGLVTREVLWIAALCMPATVLGAVVGARVYVGVSERTFQRVILVLLFVSGSILIGQTMT